MNKNSELVGRMKKWVDAEYAGGRVTVLTDGELVGVIAEACSELGVHLGQEA